MSRLTRLALAIVRRYPAAWRQRYEIELAGYIEDSPTGWRDVFDLARGCVVERARAVIDPERHPTLASALLWGGRMVPALAIYSLLPLAGTLLYRALGPPPDLYAYVALGLFLPLMIGGLIVSMRTWILLPQLMPQLPRKHLPPRWAVASWLTVACLFFVFAEWGSSGAESSRLGQFSVWARMFIWVSIIRQALDLLWPSGLVRSWQLMRIGGLREQLGWARLELARCESIRPDLGPSALAEDARQVVADLEAKLADSVAALRGRSTPSGPGGPVTDISDSVNRLQRIRVAREQITWANLPPQTPAVPTPSAPSAADLRGTVHEARVEAERLSAELQKAVDALQKPPR